MVSQQKMDPGVTGSSAKHLEEQASLAVQSRVIRIAKEIRDISKHKDPSIFVFYRAEDITTLRAIIIGPPDTPYQFGAFEFLIQFPDDYPSSPPVVTALTTNRGQTRFNPNVYSCGKVCLSILNTWHAGKNERWSPVQGIDSVLHSIQSLLSPNPYLNEPSFEDDDEEEAHRDYADKIKHETIRIAVLQPLEKLFGLSEASPATATPALEQEEDKPLEKVISGPEMQTLETRRQLFLWYYDFYHDIIDREILTHPDGKKFEITDFEGGLENSMAGKYQYSALRDRLKKVKGALDNQTELWVQEGIDAFKNDRLETAEMRMQFDHIVQLCSERTEYNISLELPDKTNSFEWDIHIIASPESVMESAVISVRMVISQQFPLDQPRVTVKSPLFHHRIGSDGTLAYMIKGDISRLENHIWEIVDSIMEPTMNLDPRICSSVGEASRLAFGSTKVAPDHKLYRSKVRRSAQQC